MLKNTYKINAINYYYYYYVRKYLYGLISLQIYCT